MDIDDSSSADKSGEELRRGRRAHIVGQADNVRAGYGFNLRQEALSRTFRKVFWRYDAWLEGLDFGL